MDQPGATHATHDDDAFVAAFKGGRIENRTFHHRDHLRLAWIQIHRLGLGPGSDDVAGAIQQFAARNGHGHLYHETLTRFWLYAIGQAIRRHRELAFEDVLSAEPHLLDKNLPFKHWSRERMFSAAARADWVEPDLRSLP
jgi:hypothetical protein